MAHREQNTIDAINELKDEYPFAATMLIYVVIERQLKEFLIKNRQDKFILEKIKKLEPNYSDAMSDEDFVKEILTKKTLGTLTNEILGEKKETDPSCDRNNVMHSNLYILGQKDLSDDDRKKKNLEQYKKAKDHFIYIFKKYSDIEIFEKKEKLLFKYNEA